MATPTIKIDGSVSGAGTAGVSRDDLVLSETITLTDPANGAGTYAWVMRTRPVGSTATLSGASTPTATFVPDVEGTYLIELTFDGTDRSGYDDAIGQFISTQGGCAVKMSNGTRVPGAGETTQYGTEGWHPALDGVLRNHDERGDLDGAAEGTVWYADSSNKVKTLAPGTSGDFLQTQGASNPPQWATGAILTSTAPVDVDKSTAAVGTSSEAARQDHKHDISTGTPVDPGTANAEGTATSLARSDHVHRGVIRQNIYNALAVDKTTGSTTFVDFVTQAITTVSGTALVIYFSVSASNTVANRYVNFKLDVDGSDKGAAQISVGTNGYANSAAIVAKVTGLSAAAHTVRIQWLVSASTGQVRPVAAPNSEHAHLLVQEVLV